MELFNTILAIVGIIGWFWIWAIGKYQTGCSTRIQWGVMLMGAVLISIFLAEILQGRQPTSISVFARICFITALYLLAPLLKVADRLVKEDCE